MAARQRLGKIPLIVAKQQLGKNLSIVARQRIGINVTGGNEYTHNNRRIVGRVIFNVVRVESRKVGDYFFSNSFFTLYRVLRKLTFLKK
jgi:hypothetical protein